MTVRSIKHYYIPNWVLDLGETFGLSHAQLLDVELLSNKLTQVDLIKYLKASHDGLFLTERTSKLIGLPHGVMPNKGLGFPQVGYQVDVGALRYDPLDAFMTYAWNDKEFTERTIGDEIRHTEERIRSKDENDLSDDHDKIVARTNTIMFSPVNLVGINEIFFTIKFYLKEDIDQLVKDINVTLMTYKSLGFTDEQIWGSELGKYIAHLYLCIESM